MKKLILFLCFAFAGNAIAQKDSLIVLNKDVSINWSLSNIVTLQESFTARIVLDFSTSAFKGFYINGKLVKHSTQRIVDASHPLGYTVYSVQNVYFTDTIPNLVLKYFKYKKIKSTIIPNLI